MQVDLPDSQGPLISVSDIRIVLLLGYTTGYLLAIIPPLAIDPVLTTHVLFQEKREYPYGYIGFPICMTMLVAVTVVLTRYGYLGAKALYLSLAVFVLSICFSFLLFLPELPHGNVFSVGAVTSVLAATTIFSWSTANSITLDEEEDRTAGNESLSYLREVMSFIRQATVALVALLGVLYLGAFPVAYDYNKSISTDPADILLLNTNVGIQYGFFAIFSVVGFIRYCFLAAIDSLSRFKAIAHRLDVKSVEMPAPPTKAGGE